MLPPGRLLGIDAAGTAYLLSPDRPRLRGVHDDPLRGHRGDVRLGAHAPQPRRRDRRPEIGGAARLSCPRGRAELPRTRPALDQQRRWGDLGDRRDASGRDPALAFGGPAPRTLYSLGRDGQNLISVSHDAGLTWSPPHPVDPAGGVIVGTQPAVVLRGTDTYELISTDEGASFRKLDLPYPPTAVAIDPTDGDHLVLYGGDQTEQTLDGGRTWSEIADARFGTVPSRTA